MSSLQIHRHWCVFPVVRKDNSWMNVWNYDSIWEPPINAEGPVTRWRLDSKGGSLSVYSTVGKQESQKRWSIAIRLPDCPSPVSDKPCLLCWGAAALRWWRPHVWRLCPRRTQRWLAFHSALNSPERREKIKSEISSVQVWQDLFYDFISWSHLWKEKTIIVPSLSTVFHNTWLEACI